MSTVKTPIAVGTSLLAGLIWVGCGGASSEPPRTGDIGVDTRAAPGWEPQEPSVQTPDDPMRLLPVDCQMAVYIDGKVLRTSPQVGRLLEMIRARTQAGDAQMAEYFVEHTDALVVGMDLVTDPKRARAVVVARGRYERSRVLEAFGNKTIRTVERDDRGLWVLDRTDDVVTRMLDDRTLVSSHPDMWPPVAALVNGGDGASLPAQPAFSALAAQAEIGRHTVSAVVTLTRPLQERLAVETGRDMAMAALSRMMSTIHGGAAMLDVGTTGQLVVIVQTGSAEQADALASLGTLLQSTVAGAVNDPMLGSLIRRARINGKESQLRLSVDLTEEELTQWIESWGSAPATVATAPAPNPAASH